MSVKAHTPLAFLDFKRYGQCFQRSCAITSCSRPLMNAVRSSGLGGIKKRDLSGLATQDSGVKRLCR